MNTYVSQEVKAQEKAAPEGQAMIDLDDIGFAKREKKKNCSVYMSDAVVAELKSRSAKAGISMSAYLDELLKRALGL